MKVADFLIKFSRLCVLRSLLDVTFLAPRFGERTRSEQESWVEHVRLVLRGQRQMPSLKTFHVPGSAQAHHLVVKEVRNQLVRKALERQKLYKDLEKVYNLFVQIMAAQQLQQA